MPCDLPCLGQGLGKKSPTFRVFFELNLFTDAISGNGSVEPLKYLLKNVLQNLITKMKHSTKIKNFSAPAFLETQMFTTGILVPDLQRFSAHQALKARSSQGAVV